jgi:hypothetical protein
LKRCDAVSHIARLGKGLEGMEGFLNSHF